MIAATVVLSCQSARVSDGVHDPGVTAAAEDHQPAVAQPEHERLIVEDQRIGLPFGATQCLVAPKAGLERCRTVDLTGDQRRAVQQEGRLPSLDDLEPHSLERRATRRGQLRGLEPGKADATPVPELGMDHHGQAGASQHARQAFHPRDVIPVTVAEHDHLDVGGGEAEPAHVLDHSVRRDAGIEQQRSLPPVLRDPDQRGEAGFRDQRVGDAALRTDSRVLLVEDRR